MSKQNKFHDQEFKDNAARYCIEKAPSITQGANDWNRSTFIGYIKVKCMHTPQTTINRRYHQIIAKYLLVIICNL